MPLIGLADWVDGTAGLADGIGLVEAVFEAGDAPVAAVDYGGRPETEFMSAGASPEARCIRVVGIETLGYTEIFAAVASSDGLELLLAESLFLIKLIGSAHRGTYTPV